MKKKQYANGQDTHKIDNEIITYYFKSGRVKAYGGYVNEQMQGKWIFNRETQNEKDHLWQVGNFVDNQKHGRWIRYTKNDEVEFDENFDHGKLIKS